MSDKSLTGKQRKFLENKMAGMTNYDAYIDAYPNSKNWKKASVYSRASRLLANDKIRSRLDEYLKRVEEDKIFTLNRTFYQSAEDLQKVITLATEQMEEEGVTQANSRAVIDAVKEINQMLGYTKDLQLREIKQRNELKEDKKESKTVIVEDVEEMKEWINEDNKD